MNRGLMMLRKIDAIMFALAKTMRSAYFAKRRVDSFYFDGKFKGALPEFVRR